MLAAYVVYCDTATYSNVLYSYEILNDSQTREIYDRFGVEGLSKNAGPNMDAGDIFTQFFASGFGFEFGPGPAFGARRPGGQDSVVPYEVTLEDLYNGKSVKISLEKEVVCTQCKGYVIVPSSVCAANIA